MRILLKAGSPVDAQEGFGNTPLWRTVFDCRNDVTVAALLVAAGADPDLANTSGVSPRDVAVRLGATEVTALFDLAAPG